VSNAHKEVQTDNVTTVVEQIVSVTLPMPSQPRPPPRSPKITAERRQARIEPVEQVDNLELGVADLSSGDSDETGSEDESVKYDTIKLADRRNRNLNDKEKVKTIDDRATSIEVVNKKQSEENSSIITATVETAEGLIANKSEVKEEIASKVNLKSSTGSIDTITSSNEIALSVSPDQSLLPPKQVMTEGQKNQVLVDSLVDQLVRDSVETSTGASSIITQAAAVDTSSTISTTDLITKPMAEPVKEKTPDPVPVKPSSDQSEQRQPSPNSTPIQQQQPVKTANSSKAESSPSRANNSKGKNKGNKNSPKKGNKK